LTYGDYDGSVTLGEVKRHGDTGIGTFDRLNGELILLDGQVYRAAGDGRAETVPDEETTPFCVAAFMKADAVKNLRELPGRDALYSELDAMVAARGKNRFYMIRIDGTFREICVRSVYAQEKPYRRLVDVLAQEQTVFDYENMEGTLVGLYCPPYMSALNAAGWHLHFLSADKTKGGHMLDVHVAEAVLTWSDLNTFELRLPESDRFAGFDLTVDQSADIEKVEKNK
jgi:acetolactate decarboxylase